MDGGRLLVDVAIEGWMIAMLSRLKNFIVGECSEVSLARSIRWDDDGRTGEFEAHVIVTSILCAVHGGR